MRLRTFLQKLRNYRQDSVSRLGLEGQIEVSRARMGGIQGTIHTLQEQSGNALLRLMHDAERVLPPVLRCLQALLKHSPFSMAGDYPLQSPYVSRSTVLSTNTIKEVLFSMCSEEIPPIVKGEVLRTLAAIAISDQNNSLWNFLEHYNLIGYSELDMESMIAIQSGREGSHQQLENIGLRGDLLGVEIHDKVLCKIIIIIEFPLLKKKEEKKGMRNVICEIKKLGMHF